MGFVFMFFTAVRVLFLIMIRTVCKEYHICPCAFFFGDTQLNFEKAIRLSREIDPFHKWLPIMNSFVIIKISLTNLVFELIIQKDFCLQTSLVRLIYKIQKNFKLAAIYEKGLFSCFLQQYLIELMFLVPDVQIYSSFDRSSTIALYAQVC